MNTHWKNSVYTRDFFQRLGSVRGSTSKLDMAFNHDLIQDEWRVLYCAYAKIHGLMVRIQDAENEGDVEMPFTHMTRAETVAYLRTCANCPAQLPLHEVCKNTRHGDARDWISLVL